MTATEKYQTIIEMDSIAPDTHGKYPSKNAFFRALREGRVSGDYDWLVIITSVQRRYNYIFVGHKCLKG